jgi:hypothetical protein
MHLFRRLRIFSKMGTDECVAISQAFVLPLIIWTSFRIPGLPRTQGLLRNWACRAGELSAGAPSAGEYQPDARITDHAQRIVERVTGVHGNCLVRSMTMWAMLLRRSVKTDLRVGLWKRDGRIQAHAWLEHAGISVNEDPADAQTFTPHGEPVGFDVWLRKAGNQVPE